MTTRALGIIGYALLILGVGFYVGLRHGQVAAEDPHPRASGILVRGLVSLLLLLVAGALVTAFFWLFLIGPVPPPRHR